MQQLSSHTTTTTTTWEYQDVYLQFLQLFEEEGEGEEAPADSKVKNAKRSKKDRHSKINTLRGPRDRRMRLSLDIARRFFRLQDLLGYDKASSTVQWLLTNAGAAIAELEAARPGQQLSEHSSTCDQAEANNNNNNGVSSKICRRREKEKVKRVAVERESRRMARERARERTSQKRRLLINNTSYTQSHLPIYEDLKTEELWRNKSPLFTYDTFFTQLQDEQIPEFEFGGKPWEAFNSFQTSI